jgi:outer membrane protein assembly factor BamB
MPAPSWLRRIRLPLIAVAVPVALRLAVWAMDRFEVGIEHLMTVQTLFTFALMLAVLVVAVWFAFSRWIPVRLKLAVAGLAVLAVGFGAWAVRKVEFDGQMSPHFHYRWEPTAEEQLAAFRSESAPSAEAADLTVGPQDSPQYRGPAGDGTAPSKLADDWSKTPPKLVWKHPVGGGHAGIAVAGNSLVTLEQRGGDEAVVCYDRATGRERWAYTYPARFATSEPMGGDGPRTTPSVVDGLVYALGGAGDLVCLDGKTGTKKWAVNILADAGATNLEWGMSGSPLVTDGKVIVNPGVNPKDNKKQAVAAYDRYTGAKLWANGSSMAGYASPMRLAVGGEALAVVFDADGLGGYALADGGERFRVSWRTDLGMNSAQPVDLGGGRVFISSERSLGGAAVGVVGQAFAWKNRALSARFCSPVLHAGHLFGLSQGRLVCLDAATGRQKWADGDYGNGQIVLADGKLVVTAERGFVALVKADPTDYAELGRFDVFADRTWNVPALAGHRLYMRNHREMACVELPGPD